MTARLTSSILQIDVACQFDDHMSQTVQALEDFAEHYGRHQGKQWRTYLPGSRAPSEKPNSWRLDGSRDSSAGQYLRGRCCLFSAPPSASYGGTQDAVACE